MNIKTLKNDTVETVSFLVKALFFRCKKDISEAGSRGLSAAADTGGAPDIRSTEYLLISDAMS